MQRCYYFDYFPVLLQDKMAKEPRLSALAACNDIANAENILQEKFTADEWNLYNTMLQQSGNIQTSSAGRIFDAVASLLNLSNKQTYEGEAALYLQHVATAYFEKHGFNFQKVILPQEHIITGYQPKLYLLALAEILQKVRQGIHCC